MNSTIGDWSDHLDGISEEDYFQNLLGFLNNQAQLSKTIYPPRGSWFKAFEHSSFANTKVIILGQDPYHGDGQAEGLSFSVPEGVRVPPSLKNIYKELASDLNINTPEHGHLASWSKQGVLLLNSVLTVAKNNPASHANQGWEVFTDHVISLLSDKKQHLVFLLLQISTNMGISMKKRIHITSINPMIIISITINTIKITNTSIRKIVDMKAKSMGTILTTSMMGISIIK